MKKLFYLAAAITVMASCTSDSIVGVDNNEYPVNGKLKSISFGSSAAATTRADYTGATAAGKLNNN